MAIPIPWSDARNAILKQHLDANLGQYEIAKLMGCSQSNISRAMARIGMSPPPRQRRAINARGRPRKADEPKVGRNCIGVQCRDKPDRSFMSTDIGNRMCPDCRDFVARNSGAMG